MEREVLDSVGSSGGILIMWNTRSCIAKEIVRGNFSLSISFLDSEGEEFWISGVYSPPSLGEGMLFGRS